MLVVKYLILAKVIERVSLFCVIAIAYYTKSHVRLNLIFSS